MEKVVSYYSNNRVGSGPSIVQSPKSYTYSFQPSLAVRPRAGLFLTLLALHMSWEDGGVYPVESLVKRNTEH